MKLLLKSAILVIDLLGVGLLGCSLYYLIEDARVNASQDQASVSDRSAHAASLDTGASPGAPVRVTIPKINVDASIEHVGLMADQRTMDAPKDRMNVGWYQSSPFPGVKGMAVVMGHQGWTGGLSAVFDDLDRLRVGDVIYIEDEHKKTIPFVVRKIATYDPHADTSAIFASHDGGSHVALITCSGAWDKVKKDYTKRLVVFADAV